MKIKNIPILFFLSLCVVSLFSNQVKSQYTIAGLSGSVYVDIAPDTLLNPIPFPGGDEYYYIDINLDGIDDIKLQAHSNISAGGGYRYSSFLSLNGNTSFSHWKKDSAYLGSPCNYWEFIDILKPYNIGDTIKSGNFVLSGSLGFTHSIGTCAGGLLCDDWIDSIDHYVGVKYSDTANITYGWVRVNVTNYWVTLVKDFSLGTPVNGIEQFSTTSQLSINPNPAGSKIHLNLTGSSEIKDITLYNMLGEEIISTKEKDIDVSRLQEGIYFVKVEIAERILTKKIIVQR